MKNNVPEHNPQAEILFQVDNLDCADCALHFEQALADIPGVVEAHVDFMRARLRVIPQNGADVSHAVQAKAQLMGYPVRAANTIGGAASADKSWKSYLKEHRHDLTTALSGLFILLAQSFHWLGAPVWTVNSLFGLAILSGGYYVARSALGSLRATHSLDMNTLMTLAALGAIGIGEWAEGAMVMFLFSLGSSLELYTMNKARNAIGSLVDLSPREAIRLRGGREERLPIESLAVGDTILVRPGERISMDGLIESGNSAVNQAPLTGESVPVEKSAGDRVFAGTLNGQGALSVKVTHLAADNTMARIISMVEEAEAQRAPSQRFVDTFARYYTPVVVAVAASVAIIPALLGLGDWTTWLYRGLVLLVIGCPCALVISTPVSIVSAIARAARLGVLIKGGVYLEELGKIRAIAFDKTGTLTLGQPQVVATQCAQHTLQATTEDCTTCKRLLVTAAAVESRSAHPLAQAVVREATRQGLDWSSDAIDEVQAVSGRGVHGIIGGHRITVGSHSYIHDSQPNSPHDAAFCEAVESAEAAGSTVMVVDCADCGVQGFISVADSLRAGVADVMAQLKNAGIIKTIMLTGDNPTIASLISQQAGIDEFRANLLPSDKVTVVEELIAQYGRVAMVGDGVNDAPALARATVGIAMGAAGSPTALEIADVALMADNLSHLPFAIQLGQRTVRIIKQNIVFALALKAIFLTLAITGVATLWMAVFADVGASLIVILNGMRLLRARPKSN